MDEDAQQRFKRDGAIMLKSVLAPDWLEMLQGGLEANLSAASQFSERLTTGEGCYFNDYFNWRKIDQFRKFVLASPAAEIAGKLMGSKASIFYHEHVLVKDPRTSKETPWHHDQSYYPVDGEDIVSLWVPLDFVTKECSIIFVQGSHRWGRWFKPRKFATEENYPVDSDSKENSR